MYRFVWGHTWGFDWIVSCFVVILVLLEAVHLERLFSLPSFDHSFVWLAVFKFRTHSHSIASALYLVGVRHSLTQVGFWFRCQKKNTFYLRCFFVESAFLCLQPILSPGWCSDLPPGCFMCGHQGCFWNAFSRPLLPLPVLSNVVW